LPGNHAQSPASTTVREEVFRQVGGKPTLLEPTPRYAVKVRRIMNAASLEIVRHLSVQGELILRHRGATVLPLILRDDPDQVRRQRPRQLQRRADVGLGRVVHA